MYRVANTLGEVAKSAPGWFKTTGIRVAPRLRALVPPSQSPVLTFEVPRPVQTTVTMEPIASISSSGLVAQQIKDTSSLAPDPSPTPHLSLPGMNSSPSISMDAGSSALKPQAPPTPAGAMPWWLIPAAIGGLLFFGRR